MSTLFRSELLGMVRDHVIASIPNATLAPIIFDISANMAQDVPNGISFALTRSRDTEQYRNQDVRRLDHTVQIGIAVRVKMSDQNASLKILLDRIEAIERAMAKKGPLAPMRPHLVDSRHDFTPSREHLIGLIDCRITADQSLAG